MPETTKTTVTQDQDGYYRTRIPKALGDAMELGGEKVEWKVVAGNKLEVRKID